ncbi:MAG TPA: class I SAM-dependent methyltransferase [Candidatus Nitrosotalea sp.]|nr:class I SAM-dependent methyltransferase [Candidatus Nitrosotalea sp.]
MRKQAGSWNASSRPSNDAGKRHADALDAVRSYYQMRGESEWYRLDNPYEGAIEQEIHRRALADLLPVGARVLDLGGGPGRWTIWLLRRGHQVVLADISPTMLAIASRELGAAGLRADSVVEADARDLSQFSDGEFDAVLALGPFYHLTAAEDRDRAAREAARVLRPGGILVATVMVRYAWALGVLLESGSSRIADVRELLATGIYRHPDAGRFTEAHMHAPGEVAPYFEGHGFSTLRLLASQSFLNLVQEDVAELAERDPQAYAALLDIAYAAADDPSIAGISGHLLYAGRVPDRAPA